MTISRNIPTTYAEMTISNTSLLKRFSHERRYQIALNLLAPQTEDRILDYGSGDGHFLRMVRVRSRASILGYEPGSGVEGDFNKITCLEVLEHLTRDNQERALLHIRSLLAAQGRLIVSVPVEIGVNGLLKNCARILLRQAHANTTLRSVFRGLLGLKIERAEDAYIPSHIGFNYRDLERVFRDTGYTILSRRFSPLPFLHSQVFYILSTIQST